MNRRDLLKQGGALLLMGPALGATAFSKEKEKEQKASLECPPSAQTQDLIVSVLGPFCYWRYEEMPGQPYIRIMAPPGIGPESTIFKHIPYVVSTCKESEIPCKPDPNHPVYALQGLEASAPRPAIVSGAPLPQFRQESTPGAKPLFAVELPVPDRIIGIFPQCFKLCPSKPDPKYYATAVRLFYKNVTLANVQLTGKKFSFTPQFGYDDVLPVASLDINLAPQNRTHAASHQQYVFGQMESMFPWVHDILSDCTLAGCRPPVVATGGGSNCIVPVMSLP
jgi:hypothetical protein